MEFICKNNSNDGFYVYAYLRKDGRPYYIGKGKEYRAYENHKRFRPPNDRNRIIFLETNLTELGALALERRYIKWYGRKDIEYIDRPPGILINKTDGGDGASGVIQTEEHRRKNSEGQKRRLPVTDKTREKLKKANLGRKHTDEAKSNMSKASIGMVCWNNGIDNTTSREQPGPDWIRGKLITEEYSASISLRNKTRTISDESRRKNSESQKGKFIWNNGIKNTSARECPGEGWVKGKLQFKNIKGITKSEETKQKMKEAWALRKEKKNLILILFYLFLC